jgi:hypothetical protein
MSEIMIDKIRREQFIVKGRTTFFFFLLLLFAPFVGLTFFQLILDFSKRSHVDPVNFLKSVTPKFCKIFKQNSAAPSAGVKAPPTENLYQ